MVQRTDMLINVYTKREICSKIVFNAHIHKVVMHM
jgi:hypothetical protein